MKQVSKMVLGIVSFVFLQTYALGAEAPKIGVIDIQEFQKRSKVFQKTSGSIRQKFDSLQQKLDDEKSAIQKLEEELKKQSMILSLDAQEDKKRELERRKRYYKYLYDDSTQEMKGIEIEATKKILKELEKIVAKIGDDEKFTLILNKRTVGLFYSSTAIDITDKVVKIYDKLKR